jgi:hypothetical protein
LGAIKLESGTNAGRVAHHGNGGQRLLTQWQLDGDHVTDVYGPLYDGSQTALAQIEADAAACPYATSA